MIHILQELETDIEIKSKSITKLEADSINSTADFNSSKINLLFPLANCSTKEFVLADTFFVTFNVTLYRRYL